jgi:hypothetical protein
MMGVEAATLCGRRFGRRKCIKPLGHHGVHWDGRWHHNTPDTWAHLAKRMKKTSAGRRALRGGAP